MSSNSSQDAALRLVFLILVPSAAIACAMTFMRGEVDFRSLFLGNPFFAYAMAGFYAMHVLLCDQPRERGAAAICGLATFGTILIVQPIPDFASFQATVFVVAGLLALSSLAIQTREILRGSRATRRMRLAVLRTSLILPIAISVTPLFLRLSSTVNPTFDLHLFAFEATFGAQPSAVMVALFDAVPPLRWLCTLVYVALPLPMAILSAYQRDRPAEPSIIVLFTAATLVGFSLYFVFPIAGPLQVFGEAFPYALPPVDAYVIQPAPVIAAPRNGMPSLHATWAYLLWFNVKSLPRPSRTGFYVFVVLTLMATLGMRDAHWLTDLVVALPMAVAIQAAFTPVAPLRAAKRWRAVLIGAALVGAWFLALRYGIAVFQTWPGLSWAAVAATAGLSIALLAELELPSRRVAIWRRFIPGAWGATRSQTAL